MPMLCLYKHEKIEKAQHLKFQGFMLIATCVLNVYSKTNVSKAFCNKVKLQTLKPAKERNLFRHPIVA